MVSREYLLNWFIRGTFFSKTFPINTGNKKCELNIYCEEDVLLAVKKAYIDMSPRTIRTKKGEKKQDIDKEARDEVLKILAKNIKKYISKRDYSDFDTKHEKFCKDFLDDFNKVLSKSNHNEVKYGKAQKIVNMTFKYLYCFDDAENYADLFEKCHMAIDSYIIEWYNENVVKSKNVKKIKETWSNLTVGQYTKIQKNIGNYLNSEDNKKYSPIPFYAEFIIWQEEKAKAL